MAQLFRKSSVEKLSSPEQLDKAIILTSPMSWLLLAGVAIIIVCFSLWAFFGTLPYTVRTKGIVSNGVYTNSVHSEFSGTVNEIYVNTGDTVSKGTLLCTLRDNNGKTQNICAKQDCVIAKLAVSEGESVNLAQELFGISPVSDNDLFVTFYISLEQLPIVKQDMDVFVNLPGFDNQKYGHMKGKIVCVDEFACDESSIKRNIGNNKKVISYINQSQAPVVAVTCKLQKDNTSQNRLYWSNKNGKSLNVNIGSAADVKIVIDSQRPISKLFPAFEN